MLITRNSTTIALASVLLSASVSCGATQRPDGGTGLLTAGAPAPEVVGYREDGSIARLSASQGHAAVVYFYPKDGTPGCTKEACAFRDAWDQYSKKSVEVFGVSRDSRESHDRFRKEHKLPFPLVPDENGEVARSYGVGSILGMSSRVTFLVGADGRIARVWKDVDPGIHAKDVLAAVAP